MLIPSAAFEQHIIVLGKTRSGKSSVMRLLVENLLDHDKPVTIIDPKGDWWGLKASSDGKKAGYPVVIFGGEHADVPINARSGGPIAELLATGNRSAIVDLGGWMPGDRTQFWIDFASTYFRTHRGRRWLVIDEVHNFCFKGKVMSPDAGKMLHWSNRLASEGLGKGISMLSASQRPQKVHNDFLTSCETLIAMKVIHAADREALSDWIDGCGDLEQGKELIKTIAQVKRGEGWGWSPEAEFGPKRMQFPLFKTYDSFKAQGLKEVKLKGWAEVNLDEVRKKLESAVKEAEANDPNKLKQKVRELSSEVLQLKTKVASRDAAMRGGPQVDTGYVKNVTQLLKEEREFSQQLEKYIGHLHNRLAASVKVMAEMKSIEQPKRKPSKKAWPVDTSTLPKSPPFQATPINMFKKEDVLPSVEREPNKKLRSGAERLLSAVATWYPNGMTEGQMRSHAGLKKSGTLSAYMSDLRRGQYIEEKNGLVYATEEGLNYCQHIPAAPQSTEDVLNVWNPKLRDGARRMLRVLVEAGGEQIPKEELYERAELRKSGTASAYLSDLRTARLVVVTRDGVAADKETLFL